MKKSNSRVKQQKLRDAGFIRREDAIRAFADHVLRDTGTAPHIAIGPVVWDIPAGHDQRQYYFAVCSADVAGTFRADCLRIAESDKELAEWCRTALTMEFIARRPIVMHDFDDELRLAKFCESLWPCERTTSIRTNVEAEFAARR